MSTKKLFVAIGFDEDFAKAMEPWIKKMRKSMEQRDVYPRWTPPQNYHVTLVFLGDTSIEKIPEIEAHLKESAQSHAPFTLKIRGLSAFPSLQQGRVFYIGVQRAQELLNLQSDLEKRLLLPEQIEFDYKPHLTIARLKNPQSCRDLLSPFEHIDLKKQSVESVALYESVQTGAFPVYNKLFSTPFFVDRSIN